MDGLRVSSEAERNKHLRACHGTNLKRAATAHSVGHRRLARRGP